MISKSMFYGEQKISDYRDMKLKDILIEHLLFKGTRLPGTKEETNKSVSVPKHIWECCDEYNRTRNVEILKTI